MAYAPHLVALSLLALARGDLAPPPADTLPADFGRSVPAPLRAAGASETEPDPKRLALGRALFFDPLLSVDRTVSCASCHRPDHGFADPARLSLGVRGQRTRMHAPSLLNRGLGASWSWNGSATTLVEQVLRPIHDPLEMGLPPGDLSTRLRADARHGPAFEAAFGRPATDADAGLALALFVGRIYSAESAVDRFQAGAFEALDASERAGLWLHESKAGCWRCHSGRNYSDEGFHATGVGAIDGVAAPGRMEVTGLVTDRGRFKTPTLRGVASTAPYMHDGSLATIEDVIAFYRRGGEAIAERDEHLAPLDLTDEEVRHLAAFLRALSR